MFILIITKTSYRTWTAIIIVTAQVRISFLITEPTRCTNFSKFLCLEWNSTCFGQFLCSSSVFHCIHSNGICHTGLLIACEQDQDGTTWSCSQKIRNLSRCTVTWISNSYITYLTLWYSLKCPVASKRKIQPLLAPKSLTMERTRWQRHIQTLVCVCVCMHAHDMCVCVCVCVHVSHGNYFFCGQKCGNTGNGVWIAESTWHVRGVVEK